MDNAESGQANPKVVLSSDCSLQLDYMKLESLVIVDQHATRIRSWSCTPPVTPREFVTPEAGGVNPFEPASKVGQMIEVVTR